jgi:hypothetical protein
MDVVVRAALIAAAVWSVPVGAQVVRDTAPEPRGEMRVDVLGARRTATQVGVGAVVPVGAYVRVGATVAGGVVAGGAKPVGASGRVDAVGRFLLDPLAQHAWGPYLAGGATYRADARDRGQVYPLALIGVEGPRHGPIVPAFEAGVGGGVRLGVVLRQSQVAGWR